MDRSLSPEHLRVALGDERGLPSTEELGDLLGEAEVSLVTGAPTLDPRLIVTGWFLHSVGAALPALELYGLERQRQAFQVAGHIFDLALEEPGSTTVDRLRMTFASQVASIRGGADPNAIAAYRWRRGHGAEGAPDGEELPLQIGAALLGMDTGWLFTALPRLTAGLATLDTPWSADGAGTIFRSRLRLAEGTANLHRYLAYGDAAGVDQAGANFELAARDAHPVSDIDARWVAFHLWQLLGHFRSSSLWTILPAGSPPSVARAFTINQPAVTTLWPPQVDLLRRDRAPYALDPNVRRLVFSFPTSAVKTLLAQVLAADHLMREGTGVCFVAPTRSLCREIETSLRRRLRVLLRAADVTFDDELFGGPGDTEAVVHVMTPERLAYLLRSDLDGVLSTYGLFVFDEAHSLADKGRGWTTEWTISVLHDATRETRHRILAMSAALGNRGALTGWLDPQGQGFHFVSDWRGPRRLHGIYTTTRIDASAVNLPRPNRNSPVRVQYDLEGRLHIRPTAPGRVTSLKTTEPVGVLVLRPPAYSKDDKSTPFYKTLAPLADALSRSGPVLVITPTKIEASRLATAIAGMSNAVRPTWLADLAAARLGPGHPLVDCLKAGVAFHHASLPSELLIAIESEVVDGGLRVVVATTTLTEGVNLPVKTVLIAAQGSYGAAGFEEFITGARLLNAIGRAGRAARESEGWIVLARNAEFDEGDFDRLTPTDDDLPIRSTLTVHSALEELAELERRIRAGADAALEYLGSATAGFVAFVWYLAALAESHDEDVLLRVERSLTATLAWGQLDAPDRARYLSVARGVVASYRGRDAETRRRWSTGGTSVASAARLEVVAAEIADLIAARGTEPLGTPVDLLRLMLGDGRLARLYELPEAAVTRPRNQRGGRGTRDLPIDDLALLVDWVSGEDVQILAERYLGEIADSEFRLEQLADLTTSAFDNFLPWALGILVVWVNARLVDRGDVEARLPDSLAGLVRYGVASEDAVRLIRAGLVSRPLATKVAEAFAADAEVGDRSLRQWLCDVDIAEWRERFDATPLDLRLLLEYARPRDSRLAARLLNDEEVDIPVRPLGDPAEIDGLELRDMPEDPAPPRVGLWLAESLVATVRTEHQAEVDAVRATGIPLVVRVVVRDGAQFARIRLRDLGTEAIDDTTAGLASSEEGAHGSEPH